MRYRTVRTYEKNTEEECLAQGMRIAASRLSQTGQWGLRLAQVTSGHVEPVEFLKRCNQRSLQVTVLKEKGERGDALRSRYS